MHGDREQPERDGEHDAPHERVASRASQRAERSDEQPGEEAETDEPVLRRHYAGLTHLKGKEPKKAASHDTPVTVVAESGLVGLALFVWTLVAAFVCLARTRGDPFTQRVVLAVALALTAIGVHSLFYDHFFEDSTTWALLGVAGLAFAAARQSVVPGRPPGSRSAPDTQSHAVAGVGSVGAR